MNNTALEGTLLEDLPILLLGVVILTYAMITVHSIASFARRSIRRQAIQRDDLRQTIISVVKYMSLAWLSSVLIIIAGSSLEDIHPLETLWEGGLVCFTGLFLFTVIVFGNYLLSLRKLPVVNGTEGETN